MLEQQQLQKEFKEQRLLEEQHQILAFEEQQAQEDREW
jgi:hypothetical protein